MASISRTLEGRYRVLWRELGVKRQKNFKTKAEAKKFQALKELSPQAQGAHMSVAQLLVEYRDKETPSKASARTETLRINALLERTFTRLSLGTISAADIEDYAKERAKEPSKKYPGLISPSTILKEVKLLSVIFSYAQRRGLMAHNPAKESKKPLEALPRERTASDEDIQKLLVSSGWDGKCVPRNEVELTMAAFLLSCATGMRSGEILRLEEAWLDGHVAHLPSEATKTRRSRDVALSSEALRIIGLVKERGSRPQIFGELGEKVRDTLWRKIRNRAGLGPVLDSKGRVIKEGLNFHDGRATFCTWAASPDPKTGAPRLDVLALARQTGHQNLKNLMRYYRPDAEVTASRLG